MNKALNTMMEHTTEPWKSKLINKVHYICDEDEKPIAIASEEDGKRIVSCVNGCTGVQTPDTTIPELIDFVKAAEGALANGGDHGNKALAALAKMAQDLLAKTKEAGQDKRDLPKPPYSITARACGKSDQRRYVLIERGPIKLAIAGYDMLPHRVDPDESYKRIQWEEFRSLMTSSGVEPASGETSKATAQIKKLGPGKYLVTHAGRTSEVIHFPNGPWIVTDVTRPDARTVVGEYPTLSAFRDTLKSQS
jgi:hypothetical protein